jgi:predicted HicB family RNase H-like nuclease
MTKRPEKVTLTIPEDLKRTARARAILEGKSLSEVVREALELYVQGELPVPPEVKETGN